MGKTEAQRLYREELQRTQQVQADITLALSVAQINNRNRIRDIRISEKGKEADDESSSSLVSEAGLHLDKVGEIAKKSLKIKGELRQALKDSASAVREIVELLVGRSTNEEVRTLRAANQRLQEKMGDLRRQMEELRGSLDSPLANGDRAPLPTAAAGRTPARVTRNSQRSALAMRQGEERMEVEATRTLPAASASRKSSLGWPNMQPTNGAGTDPHQAIRENPETEALVGVILRKVGFMLDARLDPILGRLPPEEKFRPPLGIKPSGGSNTSSSTPPSPPARQSWLPTWGRLAEARGRRRRRPKRPSQVIVEPRRPEGKQGKGGATP